MPLLFTLLLPSSEGHQYYTTCYVLAFGVQLALLLRAGYRRGYPLQTWLVLLAASTLAFILGTKLVAIPAQDWPALLQHGTWPATTARSVLGGGVGFALVILLLRRWLGFSWHVIDAFAGPLCAALVVQCMGCLLVGCCFGEPTDGSWGLTYAAGSIPYFFQQQQGLLAIGAAHSLAVHPTQLYTLVLCGGVGLILYLSRHQKWPGGSRALLQAGLLVVGRCVIEFWRDPTGEPLGANFITLGGIRMLQLQWFLLPYGAFLLGSWGLLLYHARFVAPTPEIAPTNQPVRNLLIVVGLLASTALLPVGALTLPEVLVVKTVLLAVIVLATATMLHGAVTSQRAGLPLAAASVVLLFTNQVPADSVRNELEISLGGSNGTFYEVDEGGEGCSGGRQNTRTYNHRYTLRGGNLELRRNKPEGRGTTYGLGIWQGEDRIAYEVLDLRTGELLLQTDSTKRLFSVNPYFETHSRLRPGKFGFGVRAGLHFGNLNHYADKKEAEAEASNGTVDLGVWGGVRETLFAQIDANQGALGVGNYTSRFALGSGLGKINGSTVLAGLALSRNKPNYRMGFVAATIRLGDSGFMLYPNAATNFSRHHQLNLRVGYRLPLGKR